MRPGDVLRYFREDYEIGVEGNRVEWTYSGQCTKCGLKASVEGAKRFWDSIAMEEVHDESDADQKAAVA